MYFEKCRGIVASVVCLFLHRESVNLVSLIVPLILISASIPFEVAY